MADKWVGVFTLAVLIGFVSYIESSSLLSRELAVSAPSMLAQAPAATSPNVEASAEANKLCPQPKVLEAYKEDKPKFPAKFEGSFIGYPALITNLYGKSCSERNEQLRIYITSECRAPGQCHALKYEDESGKTHDVKSPYLDSGVPLEPHPDSCKWQLFSTCAGASDAYLGDNAIPAKSKPVEFTNQEGAAPGNVQPSSNPYASRETPATTPVTTARTEPSAIDQIRAGSGGGGTQPTSGGTQQPTVTTNPTQPPSYSNPTGPAISGQPQYLGPGYNPTSPTTGPLAGNYPTYNPLTQSYTYTPSTAPWQYSPPTYQGAAQKQSGNKIFSAVTSFISGFLSVQSQPVGTSYQSPPVSSPSIKYNVYVPGKVQPGPGSVTYIIVNNPPSKQQPGYAPTDPSAQPDINEINRRIIALGSQGRRAQQLSDLQVADTPDPATSGTDSSSQPTYSVTTVSLEDAFRKPRDTKATPEPAAPEGSQGTSSAKWEGTRVVVTGIPIDISALIASYTNGWLPNSNTSFRAQAALAQAQSDYESTVAQIAALQEARTTGFCDDTCETSLTALQSEIPIRQTNINALRKTVNKKEGAALELPAPATQISRVVQDFVRSKNQGTGAPAIALSQEILDSISVPRGADVVSPPTRSPSPASVQNAPGPIPIVDVTSQEKDVPVSGEVKGESAVVNVISKVWNALKSWFLPSATKPAPQKYCSLFSRIFGGCK